MAIAATRRLGLSLVFAFAAVFQCLAQDSGSGAQPSVVTERYGAWVLECIRTEADEPTAQCRLQTTLAVRSESGGTRPLLRFLFAPTVREPEAEQKPELALVLGVQTPPDVYLRSPVIVRTSGNGAAPLVEATYFRCQANACLADAVLEQPAFEALNSAKAPSISFETVARQVVSVEFPTDGLADAARALQAKLSQQ